MLPDEDWDDWLANKITVTWKMVAIAVVFVAMCGGLLELKRKRNTDLIGWRILCVSLAGDTPEGAGQLRKIRFEIQERVKMRWWNWAELGWQRWQYLHNLIDDRIKEVRENSSWSMIRETHSIRENAELRSEERDKLYSILEARAREIFAHGEIDASQRDVILHLIQDCRSCNEKEEASS